VIIYTGVLISP